MKYRTVLVEHESSMLSHLAGALKADSTFDLASTYHSASQALGQSSVFLPNLFIIDVDDNEALSMLPNFISLFPNAAFLGTMEAWKADRAERVIQAGALGCVQKPFRARDILEAIRLYTRRGQKRPTRTMAFFSPKGHSGRTTLASVMAIELAKKSGEAVAIIDADLQFGDVSIFFDAVPQHNVVEASHDIRLLTPAALEPYFQPVGNGIWIMGGPTRPEHAELVEANQLIDVVRMAGSLFRYVLLDLPSGFNPISLALAEFADTDILVSMISSGQEVRHMKRSMKMFHTWDAYGKRIYPLFAGVKNCTSEQKRKIEEEFGRHVTKILPEEKRLTSITGSGRLMKDLPEDMPYVSTVASLANDIVVGRR
ncbi:MinD/ParA family protein [Selenomonas sp. AB3002]|uniref:MinD/ParA family protein n=1 Tax=Selenomonas sp. AB3002 TaxID=1392502 RepID=UPI0004953948